MDFVWTRAEESGRTNICLPISGLHESGFVCFCKRTPRNWSLHFPRNWCTFHLLTLQGQGLSNAHVMAQENLAKDLLITNIFLLPCKMSWTNPDQIANTLSNYFFLWRKQEESWFSSCQIVFRAPWLLKFIAKEGKLMVLSPDRWMSSCWCKVHFSCLLSSPLYFLPSKHHYICKNDSSTQWAMNYFVYKFQLFVYFLTVSFASRSLELKSYSYDFSKLP